MTADALAVVKCIFETIWMLFTTWYIPGTHATPAGFILFLVVAGLVIGFIRRIFSLSSSGSSSKSKSNGKSD